MAAKLLIGIAAALGLAAGGVVAGLALTSDPTSSSPSTTFTLRGSVTIENNNAGSIGYTGANCHGAGGFSDLVPGTAVTISNTTGQVVATGALGTTRTTSTVMSAPAIGLSATPYVTGCTMSFAVQNVPDGLPSYVVTISHRAGHVVPGAVARDDVKLSIG